ncbi:MAG: hypothetical protein RMK65_11490, partial [Anaerolineae bacterium]|nr:hypothetical protein [Anaerolineae bacterium]
MEISLSWAARAERQPALTLSRRTAKADHWPKAQEGRLRLALIGNQPPLGTPCRASPAPMLRERSAKADHWPKAQEGRLRLALIGNQP